MHKAWLAGRVSRQNPEPNIDFLSWSHLLFHTVKGTFLWTLACAFTTSFSFKLPVQTKGQWLQFRCCFLGMFPGILPLCSCSRDALVFSEALVGAQPQHTVGNIWSCGGKPTTTHAHDRKPCCVATTQACLLYPDEIKLSQPCFKNNNNN